MLKMHYDEVTTDLLTPVADNLFQPVFDAVKALPDGTLERVYRALASAIHPDHGGTNDLMTALNQAYESTKK